MRRLTLITAALIAAVTFGCAAQPNSGIARTPDQFLSAIKDIAEHNDITDTLYVERKLRLSFVNRFRGPTIDDVFHNFPPLNLLLDISVASIETRDYKDGKPMVRYGQLKNDYQDRTPAMLSETLNTEALCASEKDVIKHFANAIQAVDRPSASTLAFHFEGKNSIRLYVNFESGCASSVSFYQNQSYGLL
ncbi:hypothetical protein [Caballeronia sp. KNU42]